MVSQDSYWSNGLNDDKYCSMSSIRIIISEKNLTPKHRETHRWVVSTMAIDALMLKHQAISIHNADYTFIFLDQFYRKILHL